MTCLKTDINLWIAFYNVIMCDLSLIWKEKLVRLQQMRKLLTTWFCFRNVESFMILLYAFRASFCYDMEVEKETHKKENIDKIISNIMWCVIGAGYPRFLGGWDQHIFLLCFNNANRESDVHSVSSVSKNSQFRLDDVRESPLSGLNRNDRIK